MSNVSGMCLAGIAAVFIMMASATSTAHAQQPEDAATVAAPATAPTVQTVDRAPQSASAAVEPEAEPVGLMGLEPIRPELLDGRRGGTDTVHNDMLSQGVVSENQAVNVTTGANFISEGSFANAGGVPMVVQNTGNNVLIQNSTILNIQLK